MNQQLSINFSAARAVGEDLGELCASKAERVTGFDREGARKFILGELVRHGQMTGEALTDSAKAAGYRPHDDRAFGAVFGALVKRGLIRTIGYATRVKGHGTGGARIWVAAK